MSAFMVRACRVVSGLGRHEKSMGHLERQLWNQEMHPRITRGLRRWAEKEVCKVQKPRSHHA